MGNNKKPPDKANEHLDSESDNGLANLTSTRSSTSQKSATKRKRLDTDNKSSTCSNIGSDSADITKVTYKKFTKSELKNYVSKLVKNTTQQNNKMSELYAKLEEMSSTLENLRSEIDKNKQIEPNNAREAGVHSNSNGDDTSPGAAVHDCSDDDEMETSSIISDLLHTTNNTQNESTQLIHCVSSDRMDEFRQRNLALRDAGSQKEGRSSIGSDDSGNNGSGSAATVDNTHNKKTNAIDNKKANGKNADNQIIISKPLEANKENNGATNKIKFNKKKSPEIIVYNIVNKKETLAHLQSLLGHDRILLRYINKDKTAILTENKADRTQVLEFLSNNKTRYFTFTPSDEKPLNFLIKYVDESFSENDIKGDLLLINKEIGIRKLKVFNTNKPLVGKNIWLLTTENDEKAKLLVGTQKLCSTIVKIDILKSNSVLQCKRCQRFDHAAGNCHNTYRCVKCGKEEEEMNSDGDIIGHKPGECPLNKNKVDGNTKSNSLDLFCCNCKKSGHPANFAKCEKFAEQINKKKARAEKAVEKKQMFNNFVTTGMSFVDQIKLNKNNVAKGPKAGGSQSNSSPNSQNDSNKNHNVASQSNNSFMQDECQMPNSGRGYV